MLKRQAGCTCHADHVPGKHNVIADEGSRSSAFAHAWNTDPLFHAGLREDLFRALERDPGTFVVDLFADREGLLSRVNAWCFQERSAF